MSENSACGKVFIGCFFIIWCSAAFGMGYMEYNAGAPIIFPFVAFGMGTLGLIMCIGIMTGKTGTSPRFQRPLDDAIVIDDTASDDYEYEHRDYHYEGRDRRSVFQVPSKCPECGAAINTEGVEWVGPLQAQCPYCMATIDVQERRF